MSKKVSIGKGNFLWAIGGKREFGKALNDTTVYNINEDKWYSSLTGELSPMPKGVQGAGWTLFRDKIYCFGGKTKFRTNPIKDIQVYDIKNDKWTFLSPMPKTRSKLAKFYPVVEKRYVYLFGGDSDKGTYSRVNWNWKFDLEKKEWDFDVADAPHTQSFPSVTYHKGWIYYITGNTGKKAFHRYPGSLNQRYHPKKDIWEVRKPCPLPVTDGEGDKWKGEFHFLGGWNANPLHYNGLKKDFKGKVKKQHLVYNYEDDTWKAEKRLPGSWHHGGARSSAKYLWRYLGSDDEEVRKTTKLLRIIGLNHSRELQHTNKIFKWDGKTWEEKAPAPIRKMNFGTIYSTLGPISS